MGGPNIFKKMLAKSSANNMLGAKNLELAKHFRLIKKLGQGGYSTVYEVERLSDRGHYALKVTNIQELKPSVAHEHPHLVQYHEAFVDHDKLCIVTELMPGGDLASIIMLRYERMQRFSEGAIWSMFLQIAVAVQYLHHNHIMHRDLKPQNVLVGADGSLSLADLGIAEILDRVFTETKSGTPHYMPPEFWRFERCSYSGDVWALGCVLHELCALRPLFLCRQQQEMEAKMLGGAWERLPRRYSDGLQGVVDALLTVDPARRPTMDEPLRSRCASSGSLADDLVPRLLSHIPAPLHPDAPGEWDELNDVLPPARYASGGGSHGGVPLPAPTPFQLAANGPRPAQGGPQAMPDLGQLLGPAAGLGGVMAPQAGTLPLSRDLAAGRMSRGGAH
ncbi:Serine/threonine-protein kinase Nek1 [Auxenochlorella protothecoides]|uniref:non-specific serine/threonine protein kinase n=1 Tax=Auxenochlorella protothecoides TaxID=3075 RepID=A0A087SGR9_AUXPR|nr:Serine/threonine-protein kinase Nek1 [Auxenochlorella protothecoides]KFM24923.1 Serine/threonine-protein kinase Nek1 [Auxenochlorella protothecoides]